ncbi:TMV resistance protein N, partial [Trifolium medium]|nr:TMV resistance protein N [Trifolium medium]
MGGSGKTTAAKAIYHRLHGKFLNTSFIENFREVCEDGNSGIIHLQQQLLSDILNTNVMINSIAEGEMMISERFQGKKVLVVLDDVIPSEQLEALCANRNLFGPGSVLIITTGDVHLLELSKVDYVYTMKEMDENESLELFSWHAFRQPSPIKDFNELSRNTVAYCRGLPLALEVVGSYLFDRTKQEWMSVLSKLERISNDQVQEILRISYDGLMEDMVKHIFLDISCFFIGMDRADATRILIACGFDADIGIDILIERSLVKIEKNNKLGMHDLIRDMGREIVRKSSAKHPGKRSRLWSHKDAHDILTKNLGPENVEGLVLNAQRTDRVCFSTDAFKKMKNLRLLQLDHVDLTGDYSYFSKQLNIKQVWNGTKVLVNLKILNISHSRYLKSSPDFSKMPNLEKLIMKDCPCLAEIHPSIGDLKNLILINLKDCT